MNVKSNNISVGLLAHVDAGKTTLSEGLLFVSGAIRSQGRVDKGDAFLDSFYLERQRGITIFSKQARLQYEDTNITLLDTPGHVDFSGEMERVLSVLDLGIVVINGANGVQAHTKTLWRLLESYNVPVIIFVNKLDQANLLDGTVDGLSDMDVIHNAFIKNLSDNLKGHFVDFSIKNDDFYENVALSDEAVMDDYLEGNEASDTTISKLIQSRKLTPVFFGSALKLEGVRELLDAVSNYKYEKSYPEEFGARVFKITRDDQNNRITHLKITGGQLKVKDSIETENGAEKINQIRLYSGDKFEAVNEVFAGDICAVTGLSDKTPGMGLGNESNFIENHLEPVLTYRIVLPDGIAETQVLPLFQQLQDEEPLLNISWNPDSKELLASVMGDVQVEVLKDLVKTRFDLDIEFENGKIVYKETIKNKVEGVGHFEPLRHYAEVHLILEPGPQGSGMQFETDCPEEILAKNWQRLIMTHLQEKTYKGVLTGSAITDMKITVVAGKAHLKHTEGGDFRQATYRAVRQGLMEAESVLLEPFYQFEMILPSALIGRAMTDIDEMKGVIEPPETVGDMAILRGKAPVSLMRDYQKEVMAYSKGEGQIELNVFGYLPCHNPEEVIEKRNYDPERDMRNPTGSVFCEHGAGVYVPWDEVKKRMHVESVLEPAKSSQDEVVIKKSSSVMDIWIDVEEVDEIIHNASNANKNKEFVPHKGINKSNRGPKPKPVEGLSKPRKIEKKDKYLLVDGYNVIYAWPELKDLAGVNIAGARDALADVLINYRGMTGVNLILVFDAYRVEGHKTESFDLNGITVVYTKTAETADQFIEKFAHQNGKKYDVTVATSDGLEQIIIRGAGCGLISAREFKEEIERASNNLRENYKISE